MGTSLAERLGHAFRDPALLRQALTHRSFGTPHNERLEFVGDAVLNCVVARALYERFPGTAEGDLSRARASLVNQDTLARVARRLGLGDELAELVTVRDAVDCVVARIDAEQAQ